MPQFPLPAEDRARSPRTGFTRAHWEAAADGLLAAAWRHATPRGALLHLPGGRPSMHGRASDGLEGFARSFLLAASRLRGAGGRAEGALATRYAEGLAHGPGAVGEEAWPPIVERSQPMVEAASVALALYETRPWIWDGLAPGVQERLVDWLSESLGKEERGAGTGHHEAEVYDGSGVDAPRSGSALAPRAGEPVPNRVV